MADFLKSALGYFSGGTPGREDNDFVGQSVELGSQKLRVKSVIAEGKSNVWGWSLHRLRRTGGSVFNASLYVN